jgi:hypothetical protein
LTTEEYEILLEKFDYSVKQNMKMYTLQGERRKRVQAEESKNSSLLGSRKKLDFMLVYMKENMNQYTLGYFLKMSQSKVSQWFSYLLPVLEESLKRLGYLPVFQEEYTHCNQKEDYVFGDITERELPRKKCYEAQKEDYSGKKHLHTEKNFALCDQQGYIHFISASYTGKTHDKAVFDDLNINTGTVPFLMDLGFLGSEEVDQTILLPFKKPKGGKLNKVQKQLNQAMASARVKVEHAFSGVKRLKIIGQKIRIPSYQKRQCIFKIATAIHNLRVSSRNPIQLYS